MDLWGPHRLVLQSLQDLQGDSSEFFRDSEIAQKARMPLNNVQNCLIVLHEDEFISLSRLDEGFSASIEFKGRTALKYPSSVPFRLPSSVKIMPKGLRPFEAKDSDFFLDLLPGPRNQHGLPESVSYWKGRIEERDPDKTFRVGVIYGPSGCGKTSLVKAGLIPNLTDDILVVAVEASPEGTESLLLNRLGKKCPGVVGTGLPEVLSVLSKESELPEGRTKVLLIIDQLEQWLHAHRSGESGELAVSLKNCDGVRLQAIVMVRADFLMGLTRFMAEVEVTIRQDLNYAAIDLFGQRHAKQVLKLFGQAYGALPADDEKMTKDQWEFLDDAVRDLARGEDEERIASVRLALFAQMLSEKEWTPSTLGDVGGAAGVGVTFLEETFDTDRGRRRYQINQSDLRPIRSILKDLLPDVGTGIKGGMKSEEALLRQSGCEGDLGRFQRLIRLLDSEIRLLTPTYVEEASEKSLPGQSDSVVRYYQLTHDYLVPSIREWLTRKQRETRRGRAQLLLEERAALWKDKPENRLLPSPLEWLRIRSLTRKRDWTDPQRKMLRVAGRVHGQRALVLATALILVGWGLNGWVGGRRAESLRDKLLGVPLVQVPDVVKELNPYRRWVDPLLIKTYEEAKATGNDHEQLRAGLALLPVNVQRKRVVPYLEHCILRAEAQDIPVLCKTLAGYHNVDEFVYDCWRILEKLTPDNRGKALQAASALAMYVPQDSRWTNVSTDVANLLVTVNPFVVARWTNALRPVATQLRDPLKVIFRDERRSEGERTLAAAALAEYVSDQPSELVNLLLEATESRFAVLYPTVAVQAEQTASPLENRLDDKRPSIRGDFPTNQEETNLEKFYKRQANAAVALIRMGRPEKAWPLLKQSSDPSLRSYLVHHLGPRGQDAGLSLASLKCENEVSIRRALILSLGEYTGGQIRSADRVAWTTKLLDLYRNDPDPGIHGAADWVLRQWGHEQALQAIDEELAKLPLPTVRAGRGETVSPGSDRRWYVNGRFQTMTIIPGPVEFTMGERTARHRERIAHNFAIAVKEVTVEQFQRFMKENSRHNVLYDEKTSPVRTCPMNTISWYDAAAYCNWLSEKEGLKPCYQRNEQGEYADGMTVVPDDLEQPGYRLPTEAEWEHACRAGTTTAYSIGEPWELLAKYGRYGWYLFDNASDHTHPVGSLKPNDLGLFDLHGNQWEWCQRTPRMTHRNSSVKIYNNSLAVLRGGAFNSEPWDVRSAYRLEMAPLYRHSFHGFRPSRAYP